MDRRASREEIRRSYRRLARRYHPDARVAPGPPGSPTSPLAGRAEIVRLNEAWRVLRDPTLRRRYDASLRPPPVMPVGFYDREGWGAFLDPVYEPVRRRPRPAVARRRDGRLHGRLSGRVLLILGVLAVLAGIAAFTAYAGGGAAGGASGRAPSSAPLGSCITIPVGQTAKVVPCGQTNDGMVVAPNPATRACPRGAQARALKPAGPPDICLAPR